MCLEIYMYVYVKYTTSSDTKRVDHEYQSFGLEISKLIGFNDPSTPLADVSMHEMWTTKELK